MLCVAFIVCLALLPGRRRQGLPIGVPVGVIALGAIRGVLFAITIHLLTASFKDVARARPEDRAGVLQASIDAAMPYATFGMCFEVPLLIAAWFADRALLKRHQPPAQPAPQGASCATHAGEPATVICVRCGGFMCASCGAANASLCSPCSAR